MSAISWARRNLVFEYRHVFGTAEIQPGEKRCTKIRSTNLHSTFQTSGFQEATVILHDYFVGMISRVDELIVCCESPDRDTSRWSTVKPGAVADSVRSLSGGTRDKSIRM